MTTDFRAGVEKIAADLHDEWQALGDHFGGQIAHRFRDRLYALLEATPPADDNSLRAELAATAEALEQATAMVETLNGELLTRGAEVERLREQLDTHLIPLEILRRELTTVAGHLDEQATRVQAIPGQDFAASIMHKTADLLRGFVHDTDPDLSLTKLRAIAADLAHGPSRIA